MRTRIQSEITCVPPVTAERSPPDWRRFAGNGGLVDRGDAFDHLAVGGDHVGRLDQHDIADLEVHAGHQAIALVVGPGQELGLRLRARAPQGLGLRLAAPLGDGLGEVREQHREPQPEDDLDLEQQVRAAGHQIADQDDRDQRGDDLQHEHDRVLDQRARVELHAGRADRRPDDLGIEHGRYRHSLAGG
jgi:hypothetical protein